MKMSSGIRKAAMGGFCFLTGLAALAQLQPAQSVVDLSFKKGSSTYPVAAYRNMSGAEFRSMLRTAFQESGFTFVAVDEPKNKSTLIRFNFNADPKVGLKPEVLVTIDELLDGKRRCNPCFLRFAEVGNASEIAALPWMTQYDLNALLLPAIDKAHATVETRGREHLDPSFGFNYRQHWTGEKNLFGNSFVGISQSGLKDSIVRAYRNAGFLPVESETASRSPDFELGFSFPIDPPREGGAIYKLRIRSQYDADGNCHPCELTEQFNPHQPLPPSGLSGILNRATLESRFTAARSAAFESVRGDLERYLRPRSSFSVPPKPAAVGSPPPPPTMPVST